MNMIGFIMLPLSLRRTQRLQQKDPVMILGVEGLAEAQQKADPSRSRSEERPLLIT